MARETWTLYSPPAPGGYVLTDGWVRDVETREGLYRTPPKRGDNGPAGQQHGSEWTPKPYGEGSFQQQVWLMADLSREQVEQWYDELLRVASWPYSLVRVVRRLSDGSERECLAELATALEPAPLGQRGIRLGLDWTVPAGFWRDLVDTAQARSIQGVASGTALDYGVFRGGTAPTAVKVAIKGPTNGRVRLTEPITGKWVEIGTALTSAQTVTLDSDTGTSTLDTSGTVTQYRSVTYSGRTFLELPPVAAPVALPLNVTYIGSAPGSGATVTVTGRRRWLA